ncbi:MAG: bifunctional riboflavin kinase/FAD synthetase [Ignavibacteriales bacterium]|nr:bifunctional riboflavin kinase/FAD synthetase [Ignavibacteriales bacterium]
MKRAFQLSGVERDKNSVVTVGSFDGFHRAHQAIIQQVVERSRRRKGRSVVITFEPHPQEVVGKHKEPLQLLSTVEERQKLFEESGVDVLLILKFDYEFSRQSFREFYVRYVVEGIGVSEVVEGYDHHFGRDREGNIKELQRLGKEFGFSITALDPVYVGKEVVSSSAIRRQLLEGNIEHASELIGRPYSLGGRIVRGDGRGKELGYPTANIRPNSSKKLIPRNGIYFVRVEGVSKKCFGMTSIGVRPTFHSDGERVVEVNILDFEGDLYDREIELHFLRRLRDELKFDSAAALIQQMDKDKEASLKLQREFHQ